MLRVLIALALAPAGGGHADPPPDPFAEGAKLEEASLEPPPPRVVEEPQPWATPARLRRHAEAQRRTAIRYLVGAGVMAGAGLAMRGGFVGLMHHLCQPSKGGSPLPPDTKCPSPFARDRIASITTLATLGTFALLAEGSRQLGGSRAQLVHTGAAKPIDVAKHRRAAQGFVLLSAFGAIGFRLLLVLDGLRTSADGDKAFANPPKFAPHVRYVNHLGFQLSLTTMAAALGVLVHSSAYAKRGRVLVPRPAIGPQGASLGWSGRF